MKTKIASVAALALGAMTFATGCRLSLPGYGAVECDEEMGMFIFFAMCVVGAVICGLAYLIHATIVGLAIARAKKRTLDSEAVQLAGSAAQRTKELEKQLNDIKESLPHDLTVRLEKLETRIGSSYRD